MITQWLVSFAADANIYLSKQGFDSFGFVKLKCHSLYGLTEKDLNQNAFLQQLHLYLFYTGTLDNTTKIAATAW